MKKRPISFVIGLAVLVSLTWIGFHRIHRGQPVKAALPESNLTTQVIPDLSSPYEVQKYINDHEDEADLSQLWKRIGIPTDLGETPERCGCRGYDCPGNCNAEVIDGWTTSNDHSRVILKVCYAGGFDCWYIAFKKDPEWKYVGIVQSSNNKYRPVQYRIEQLGSDKWLVVGEGTGGTGFLSYWERWYHLSDDGFREVLVYPVSGCSVEDKDDDYELKSTVSKLESGSGFAVKIRYKIFTDKRYFATRDWKWSQSHLDELIYDWNVDTKQFRFAESKSRLQESEKDLFNISKRGLIGQTPN